MPRQTKDLTSQTFGLLTALSFAGYLPSDKSGHRSAHWKCECACGKSKVVTAKNLINGCVKSCGCATNAWKAANATKHGSYGSPAYRTWIEINRRCLNPNFKSFHQYGGRGVKVCDRWRHFENFLADMGERPYPAAEIDRIDSNGDYEPSNCRWTDRKGQMRNVRNNRYITAFGRTMIMADWAKETGVDASLICWRLKQGQSPEAALRKPTKKRLKAS